MDKQPSEKEFRKAFESLEPELLEIPEQDLTRPKTGVRQCAVGVLGVAKVATGPAWKPELKKLAKTGFWDLKYLEKLTPSAQALWFVRHNLDQINALASGAKLSAQLVKEATELRARMRHVCEFCLVDTPSAQGKLAYLRQGSGFGDLADDLFGYASLYNEYEELITKLPIHYVKGDEDLAEILGEKILAGLGLVENKKTEQWANLQRRAFTLMSTCYNEVRAAALFLGRNDPNAPLLFPALYSLGRRGRNSRGKEEQEPEEPVVPET